MPSPGSLPIFVINAFTKGLNEPFTGNQAAICILNYDDDISDETKQKIAMTMNYSETVFLSRGWSKSAAKIDNSQNLKEDKGSEIAHRMIRWFTPNQEIALCGHATFASVYSLLQSNKSLRKVMLDSKFNGTLTTWIEPDGHDHLITIEFPAYIPYKIQLKQCIDWLPEVAKVVLGPQFEIGQDGSDSISDIVFDSSLAYLTFRLKKQKGESSLETIKKVTPNYQQLKDIETGELGAHVFIVTIEGDSQDMQRSTSNGVNGCHEGSDGNLKMESKMPDFYSRIFGPYFGITEDPICGSAHAVLTPYWAQEWDKVGQELWAHQPSSRSGDLYCTFEGNRVTLKGRGHVVLEGELQL